jgi:hypothetical protein
MEKRNGSNNTWNFHKIPLKMGLRTMPEHNGKADKELE